MELKRNPSETLGAFLKIHFTDQIKLFVTVVLNSMSLLFLATTIGLAIIQAKQTQTGPTDVTITVTLLTLTSLSAGILGGIWAKKWDELTEEKVLTARGETAVRSLLLLSNDVTALKRRAREYLWRLADEQCNENITPEVIRTYIEEIIERCSSIENATLGSINNWNDVVPTADIQKQAGIAFEALLEQSRLSSEAMIIKKQLQESQAQSEQSEERIQELTLALAEKEKRIVASKQKQFLDDPLEVGTAALGTGSHFPFFGVTEDGSVGLVGTTLTEGRICTNCGKYFVANALVEPYGGQPPTCPECFKAMARPYDKSEHEQ